MAHISMKRGAGMATQLVINGVDVSMDVFRGVELVEVGEDPEFSEVGFRVTYVVSRLDLETDVDIKITDQLPAVAQRVRSMQDDSQAGEA